MKPNQQSELDAFMDFCLEHWNDPFNSLESNPELIAKLEEGIQNLLLPACEEGDENAMFWMAECYDFGWGIEPDEQKAFTLRRKLAEMGHTDQQINMGNYYREGDLVKRNPRAAFCWYMRAAKQGDWYGQLLVADCYFEGDGVKRDYKEAVKWYESVVAQFDNGSLAFQPRLQHLHRPVARRRRIARAALPHIRTLRVEQGRRACGAAGLRARIFVRGVLPPPDGLHARTRLRPPLA